MTNGLPSEIFQKFVRKIMCYPFEKYDIINANKDENVQHRFLGCVSFIVLEASRLAACLDVIITLEYTKSIVKCMLLS